MSSDLKVVGWRRFDQLGGWMFRSIGLGASLPIEGEEALVLKEEAMDKIDGLEADLRCAVQTAYNRGAKEWARLNYPQWIGWFEQSEQLNESHSPTVKD